MRGAKIIEAQMRDSVQCELRENANTIILDSPAGEEEIKLC